MTEEERPRRTDLASAIGHTIKYLRTYREISRIELAKRSGISYSYLSAIENGTKPPSTKVQVQIADALGVRVHELLAEAEAFTDSEPTMSPQPAQRWRQLMRSARPARAADGEASDLLAHAQFRGASDHERTKAVVPDPGTLAELRLLLPALSDEDTDLILKMARSLARRGRDYPEAD